MKKIPGYEGLYAATRDGKIWSYPKNLQQKKGRFLRLQKGPAETWVVSLRKEGATRSWLVHRLIALTFLPNPENKPQVNHKNGSRADNHIENLEWCTSLENVRHAWKTGLVKKRYGEDTANSKLTNANVRKIKLMLKEGVVTSHIASQFNVRWLTIHHIKTGRCWSHML